MQRPFGDSGNTRSLRDVVGAEFCARFRDHYELTERFLKRPGLAADLDPSTINQAATRLLSVANRDFIISGTNAATANSTLDTGGGVSLATATAANDQVIVSPATSINSVASSAWNVARWRTEFALRAAFTFEVSGIATALFQLGLKLTANLDISTDANFACLSFNTASSISATNFVVQTRTATGTVQQRDTGIAVAASTPYTVEFMTSTAGRLKMLLNGRTILDATSRDSTGAEFTKLATGVTFKPVAGVQTLSTAADGTAVRTLYLRQIRMSRQLATS